MQAQAPDFSRGGFSLVFDSDFPYFNLKTESLGSGFKPAEGLPPQPRSGHQVSGAGVKFLRATHLIALCAGITSSLLLFRPINGDAAYASGTPSATSTATPTPTPTPFCKLDDKIKICPSTLSLHNGGKATLWITVPATDAGAPPTPNPQKNVTQADLQNAFLQNTLKENRSPKVASCNDNVIVSDPVQDKDDKTLWSATVTGYGVGIRSNPCVIVTYGEYSEKIPVEKLVPRFIVVSAGYQYTMGMTSPMFSVVPGTNASAQTGQNFIEESSSTVRPSSYMALANVRISHNSEGLNEWGSVGVGVGGTSPGLEAGFSITPPGNDLYFLTLGVRQESRQSLFPNYTVGNGYPSSALPTTANVSETTKALRFFVGITLDATKIPIIGTTIKSLLNGTTGN